jgi:hypothetical protein
MARPFPPQTDRWSRTLEERMEFTCHDLSAIQEAIRRHRDRVAQLFDDVDALRRSAAELRIAGPNGDAADVLDLCTERIRTGDVALGDLATHLVEFQAEQQKALG